MSKKKHNISYIKPEEPKFLRELKAQAGFKEGPTVDTKREELPDVDDEAEIHKIEEEPVVVVLKAGDMTAEEAADFEKQREDEEANTPADLSKRIIFNRKSKVSDSEGIDIPSSKKSKKSIKSRIVLSFNEDEDE